MAIVFSHFPHFYFLFLASNSKFLLLVFWVLTFYVYTPGTLFLQANLACEFVRIIIIA